MQGVEILTSAQVVTEYTYNMTAFYIALIAALVILIICGIVFSIQEDDWSILWICIMGGVMVGLLLGVAGAEILETPASYEPQYKVTIDDSVSMSEFYEHYEVIDQDGKIFTVREK